MPMISNERSPGPSERVTVKGQRAITLRMYLREALIRIYRALRLSRDAVIDTTQCSRLWIGRSARVGESDGDAGVAACPSGLGVIWFRGPRLRCWFALALFTLV